MTEEDQNRSYVAYTPGVGVSSRLYVDILIPGVGGICLIGVDERTWITPLEALPLVEKLDESRFEEEPELLESSGRPSDWQFRREAVLMREQYRCQNCGDCLKKDSNHSAIVHHIVKPEHGGTERLSNLAVMCYGCHGAAHRS